MIHRLENKNGLTLLEVLASIVILSIVIVSFITLFSQMSLFNKKTEEHLDATTLAKAVLVDIKSTDYRSITTNPPGGLTLSPANNQDLVFLEGNWGQRKDKHIRVTIRKTAVMNMHEMKIDIFENKESTRPLSTIFGYIPNIKK